MNKRDKMVGVLVSTEEVIAELGRPSAEWERASRRRDFETHLRPGRTDLDIAGIRGYGDIKGHLAYLTQSLVQPLGVGTSLVSDEENAAIRAELETEIRAEIERYTALLAEQEKSPEAVEAFVLSLQRWLEYMERTGPGDPTKETDDVAYDIAQAVKKDHEHAVATLKEEIRTYTELLTTLREQSPSNG